MRNVQDYSSPQSAPVARLNGDGRPDDLAADLAATGQGDCNAFRRIHSQCAAKLFAICLNVTRDRAAAEDLLQEVFIKIWRGAAGYDPARARPLAWLCAIARNSAIDWYRAQPLRQTVSEDHLVSISSDDEPADDFMIRSQQEAEALKLASELDNQSEADLRRIFFRGLTYVEAAQEQGVPLGTMKSRVRRAVMKLRSRMSHD